MPGRVAGGVPAGANSPCQVAMSKPVRPASDRVGTSGSADERLEYFLRATVRILVAKRSYVTLLLRLRGNTALERAALERRRAVDRKLAELVTLAQQEGSLRQDLEPRTTARLLFGMINSVVDWYREDGVITAAGLEQHAISMVFAGLHVQRP